MVVAQLAEQLLPTPEDPGLNPAISVNRMARLFIQNLPFTLLQICQIALKITTVDAKICQIQNKPSLK